jgi:hypothetical protein
MGGILVNVIYAVISLSLLLNVIQDDGLSRSISCEDRLPSVYHLPDQTYLLFETYEEGVRSEDIRKRLHLVAEFLRDNPDFQGFIVSYAGKRSCRSEGRRRAEVAKTFLTGLEKIRADRLRIVDAGYRAKWVVELWFAPIKAGGQPPIRDTVDFRTVRIRGKCHITPLR